VLNKLLNEFKDSVSIKFRSLVEAVILRMRAKATEMPDFMRCVEQGFCNETAIP
jgi:hypothetical protein